MNNNQDMQNTQNMNMPGANTQAQANVQGNMQQTGMQNQQLNPYIVNQNGINNNPYINGNVQGTNPLDANANAQGGFTSGDFVKGALIGAGVAFLLTNKTTQQAIFNGFSKGSELFQAGIEELKERMEDAKAQMEAKEF